MKTRCNLAVFTVLAGLLGSVCGCRTEESMKRPIPAEIKVEPTREAESEETAELRVLLEQLQAELEKERKAKDKLEEELARLKAENQRLKALVSEKASPEDGHLRFPVEKISLGFLTGGADWDEKEGDDGLIVFLHPQDREDDTIKRAGKVRFELFDLTQEEVVVMGWDFTAEEAIKNWRNFPTGYQFKLPWKGSPPTASELILKATFTDLDGKDFIATKRIRVRLASE